MAGYGCPFGYGRGGVAEEGVDDISQEGKAPGDGMTYSQYLQLDKLLSCQKLQSEEKGCAVADEHLFIIIHQAYELWFKQIIYDIDNVCLLLNNTVVDERGTLRIVSGLERTARIMKLLVDQMLVLETMSPLDFVEFRSFFAAFGTQRNHISPASGFQSLQFRLLENKLGVKASNRVKYNAQHYRQIFDGSEEQRRLNDSEERPSLFELIQSWLERTPCSKQFWRQYRMAVGAYLEDMKAQGEKEGLSPAMREECEAEYTKTKVSFDSLFDRNEHEKLVSRGERQLSYDAMKGALVIYFYREMPRFSQPYQILTYLMDIDSLLTKWRYNHVMLVQRMLGSKKGTGGSSGYLYLRSTISDRYKVFLDLFNLSTWLIPRAYLPQLSQKAMIMLSQHSVTETSDFSASEGSSQDSE